MYCQFCVSAVSSLGCLIRNEEQNTLSCLGAIKMVSVMCDPKPKPTLATSKLTKEVWTQIRNHQRHTAKPNNSVAAVKSPAMSSKTNLPPNSEYVRPRGTADPNRILHLVDVLRVQATIYASYKSGLEVFTLDTGATVSLIDLSVFQK
ncbi:hypothetical protein PROFUN_16879 [Planoprotostelium fungivorum]|uniref:Uncharacterized protein n=1 Tax=Planoprotostelium fungivorum TaxID=1890364 RepID=A0A2P6MNQ7_9EUKA|nr:hypothetical protein PROFUN_16879 [Planoprotostelium fungivorum]